MILDDIFKSNENFTFKKLMNGKSIFLKYWLLGGSFLNTISYYPSPLPGLKEGVSGSLIFGNNIGIDKNIKSEKKEAALKVLKYISSIENQRKMFENGLSLTSLTELLNDREICKNAPCDLTKEVKMQYIGIPKIIKEGPENYSEKYKKYIYRFIYEDKPLDEILKNIVDVTKYYYVSLDISVGLFFFIFFLVISVLMLLSLRLLYLEKFRHHFIVLSNKFWIIMVLGSVLILWIPITNYGPTKSLKCHLKLLLLSIGLTFNYCPPICNLISQFPKRTKWTMWINQHKNIFLLINVLIDVSLNILSLLHPFTSGVIEVEDGESFELCKYQGEYSIIILFIYKFMVIFLILFLILVEWTFDTLKYEKRYIIFALYFDILSIILLFIFYWIKIKYYIFYFVVQTINTTIISIGNYIFLYSGRLIFKNNAKSLKLEETSKNQMYFDFDESLSKSEGGSSYNKDANTF